MIDPVQWFTDFVTQARADVIKAVDEEEGDAAPTVICFIRDRRPVAVAFCEPDDPVSYDVARIGAGAFDAEEVLVCHDAFMCIGDAEEEIAGELAPEMSKMTLGPKKKGEEGEGLDVLMVVHATRDGDLGLVIHPYEINRQTNQIRYAHPQDVGAMGFLGGPGAEKLRGTWSCSSFEEFMRERQGDEPLTREQLDVMVQTLLPQAMPCMINLLFEHPGSSLN